MYKWNTVIIVNNVNTKEPFEIKKGDRIAQIVLCKYEKINFIQVENGEVANIGNNRNGGYGSSGIK